MLKALFSSKKFVVALVGAVVAVIGHFKPDFAAPVQQVIYLIITYVGGQALADIGKEKAKIETEIVE